MKRPYLLLVACAILFKACLFVFAVSAASESKFLPDSSDYLQVKGALLSKGSFARIYPEGGLVYEFVRTPGYPLFLAFLNGILRVPLTGVVLIQVILTLITAWITFKSAADIGGPAALAGLIILLDPPVTAFSMILITETLFMFILSLFLLTFLLYLKKGECVLAVAAACLLVAATYVRPISYYLGWFIGGFILSVGFRKGIKRAFCHAAVFLLVSYALLGVWQIRNYSRFGDSSFSGVIARNYESFSVINGYKNDDAGMSKNEFRWKAPLRGFISFMTSPGSFKYFKSRALCIAGKTFGYPWMVFWLSGLIYGFLRIGRNKYYQFMALVILYFALVSVGGAGLLASERFRAVIMPFIAIISAYGWSELKRRFADIR
jgi:hypothetical protein